MTDLKGSSSFDANIKYKEWDQVSCPICMDHPHNAVLLICGSHHKGCRPYVCDTSYRHSNCLDRFRRLKRDEQLNSNSDGQRSDLIREGDNENVVVSETQFGNPSSGEGNSQNINHDNTQETTRYLGTQQEERINLEILEEYGMISTKLSEAHRLKCPLCRGGVVGWMIIKEARQYLDQKPRSCSRESCAFTGNYRDLRRHARRVHPMNRPAEVDPSRQRAWRRMEHQHEYGDILSAIRSAMPGAIVLGDYVIENGDNRDRDGNGSGEGGAPWLTTFFLFQMISNSHVGSHDEPTSGRAWRSHRRTSRHRYAWGERLIGLSNEDDRGVADYDDAPEIPRRRRRFMRSRTDDEQS